MSEAKPAGKIQQRPAAVCPPWETRCVLIGLLLFLVLNVLTAERYPFVWIDEVMYSDPAVNLSLGHGFNSTAWRDQTSTEFWAGNVPLHPALISLWINVFGLSVTAVRSLNYLYVALAGLLLWRATVRLNLITSSKLRLALLALLAGGYSMVFAYRSGRPDCLPMFLVCAAIYAYSLRDTVPRFLSLLLVGALMPWAGLQVLPLIAIGGILLCVFIGKKMLPETVALWVGAAVGLASLIGFYKAHHVYEKFQLSIGQHSGFGFFGWLTSGEFHHSNLIPKDFSFVVLFFFAMAFAIRPAAKESFRSPLSFGLVFTVLLTLDLMSLGKFPTYYGWMTYLPLALCLCMAVDQAPLNPKWRRITIGFFAAAIGISLVLHGVTAIAEWRDHNYANVQTFIKENVTPQDTLYTEFGGYYAGKKQAATIFLPYYLIAITPQEKSNITVLAIAPAYFSGVTNYIGGNWITTGKSLKPQQRGFWESKINMGFLSMQNYEMEIFRRKNPSVE